MADYDMDPDTVTRGINQLRAASEDFGSVWEKHKQALQAGQARIGGDPLVQAFLESYLPLAEHLTTKADAIPGAYGGLCDDAMGCVNDYLAAENQGTTSVNRLTGTDNRETPA